MSNIQVFFYSKTRFKFGVVILFSIYFINCAFAQNVISGKVTDAGGEVIPFANIILRLADDSTTLTGTMTDTNGVFMIGTANEGLFDLKVSYLGYFNFISEPFHITSTNPEYNAGNIVLTENSTRLKDVVIKARRPLVEQKIDRMVLNIENQVSTAGATALDILERSPGVMVNKSASSIGLLGKQGVNVMINGKMNYMPQDALFAFLQGMDASNISKIELITNPPASFDAQGNAGYINIILKSNPDEGLLGNYSLTLGYGKGVTGLGALNLNYRKKKFNVYGSYNYNHNEQLQYTVVNRVIGDFSTDMTFDRRPTVDNQNYRVGLDYQILKHTTIGVLYSGYRNMRAMDALYTSKNKNFGIEDTMTVTNLDESNLWKHAQYNVNLMHKFKNEATFQIDFNILRYKNINPTDYALVYSFQQNTTRNESLRTEKTTPFGMKVLNADYAKDFNKKTKWSAGGKYFDADFENDVKALRDNMLLPEFTSYSILSEKIAAFYTEIDRQISKKWKSKIGVRYERSNTVLSGSDDEILIDRQLSRLFPSAFLQYSINADQQINFQYSKRINRPSFSNMAPFITFLDPNSQYRGNSNLQPAFSHNFQLGYTVKEFSVLVQYSSEDSTIVSFQNRFDPANNRLFITPANLQSQQMLTIYIGAPVKITDWWSGQVNGYYQYQKSNTIEDLGVYSISLQSFRINANQTIRLPRNIRMEFNGVYISPSLEGNVRYGAYKVLNWAIQKKFDDGSALTFGIDDVFNSAFFAGTTNIPEQRLYMYRKPDFSNTTFKIVYSKSFGNTKMKAGRIRNSGSEEKARVN